METQRILVTLATILATATAHADVEMGLAADKTHYQINGQTLRFDFGQLNLQIRDGAVLLDGACVIDPQLFFFLPSNIPPCPLGATGFIASGDIDRDGIRDDNQYWSIASVIPAFVIEPSRPEIPQLFSGPPSKLPRPLQNFRDDALVTFYDISTPVVRQYDQSRYELTRNYGQVRQIETARALGTVTVGGFIDATVTGSDIVGSPLTIPIPVTALDTGLDWAESVRTTFRATPAITNFYAIGGVGNIITLTEVTANGNDPDLNIAFTAGTATNAELPIPQSADTRAGVTGAGSAAALRQMNEELIPGQYIFTFPRLGSPDLNPVAIPVTIVANLEAVDPTSRYRTGFRFTSGTWDNEFYQMDPRLINRITWTGNDRSVVRPGDQFYFSILSPAEDFITFPPTVPQNPVLLSIPTVQLYTMPPFFYEVGEEGVINLRYQRNLSSNGVAADVSARRFRAKVRMVDSYPGYAQITFPVGSAKRDLAAKANIDRDSMTNIEEYAYQFPTNEDINASAALQFAGEQTVFIGEVQEFSRVISPKMKNAILDPLLQPVGPAPAFLDEQNRVVFEVPYRPRTGTTLKYAFQQVVEVGNKGKKKAQKIKIGADWELSFREEPVELPGVVVEAKVVDSATRTVFEIIQTTLDNPLKLTKTFLVLRSTAPVADVNAPLPELKVVITPVTLK